MSRAGEDGVVGTCGNLTNTAQEMLGRRRSQGPRSPAGKGVWSKGTIRCLNRQRKGKDSRVARTERTNGFVTRVRSEFRQVGRPQCPCNHFGFPSETGGKHMDIYSRGTTSSD